MNIHEFNSSLTFGKEWERKVSEWLESDGYRVQQVPFKEDLKGTDRRISKGCRAWRIQIKADQASTKTGNAFIETVAHDYPPPIKNGWAYTTEDDVLLMYVFPGDGAVACIWMHKLKAKLKEWAVAYPHQIARNRSYVTVGICVPRSEIEAIAEIMLEINDGWPIDLPKRPRRIHDLEEFEELWPAVLVRVKKKIGVMAVAYLFDAMPVALTDDEAVLQYTKEFHYEKACDAARRLPFEQVVNECMSRPRRLVFQWAKPVGGAS